jgi:pSer/pThr/pTyr-binding forkhead associated (FHA) protein
MERKRPETWNFKEVSEWLQTIGLPVYREKFEQIRIDGPLLFEVQEDDLKNDLQVTIRLHRVKILQEIQKLREMNEGGLVVESSDSVIDTGDWEVLVLKAIEGTLSNHSYLIGRHGASVGRNSASNDIVISESFVSRKHCDIRYLNLSNQFILKDLGSTTGTFLMARSSLELELNSMFQMGLSEFKVTSVLFNPFGQARSLILQVYEGPAKGKEFKIFADGVNIGRDPSNKIAIREDSQMSSHHADIVLRNGKFWLNDVGSTNRTWRRISAEGEPSENVPVVVGDVIKIGSTVLLVQMPDPSQIDEINESRNDGESVKEENACKICFAREADVCCYPCGHLICNKCAFKCNLCPICRKDIQDRVRLFK